jgi:hypothetical protein
MITETTTYATGARVSSTYETTSNWEAFVPDRPIADAGPAEAFGTAISLVNLSDFSKMFYGFADKLLARAIARRVARGGAAAVRLGQTGEAAVRAAYDIGPATKIVVNGAERIPDGLNLTTNVLSEVKNVGSLSYTQQLRDFAQYAGENGLRFDLYVRPGAELSGPLQQAVASGEINLLFIP